MIWMNLGRTEWNFYLEKLMAQPTDLPHVKCTFPKNPDPSKVAVVRTLTTAIQVRTPPLEGPGFEENGC